MTLLEREVDHGEDGWRADQALAGWLDEPRARAQARFDAGEVTVDGRPVAKSRRLRTGERVVVAAPPAAPRPAPPEVPVRYEDEAVAVVAKPAGLLVHAGAGRRAEATLVDALAAAGMPLACTCGPHPDGTCPSGRPGIVHRLDRGTSGLLVVAKTGAALEGLGALLKARAVERVYWALVEGVPDPARATVSAPIARSARRRTTFTVDPAGRPAVTHYDVEEAFGRAAVVRARLETGRTHQVRVHLASVGHPVCGDRAYGASPAFAAELGLARPALHARRIAFTHPCTGARVAVEEPLPPDLTGARAAAAAG